jgi:hypothetical protein
VSRTKSELISVEKTMRPSLDWDMLVVHYHVGSHRLTLSHQWAAYHSMEERLKKLRRFRRYAKQYQRNS